MEAGYTLRCPAAFEEIAQFLHTEETKKELYVPCPIMVSWRGWQLPSVRRDGVLVLSCLNLATIQLLPGFRLSPRATSAARLDTPYIRVARFYKFQYMHLLIVKLTSHALRCLDTHIKGHT